MVEMCVWVSYKICKHFIKSFFEYVMCTGIALVAIS